MEYKELFINLISSFLSGKLSRKEVAYQASMELPIDSNYKEDVALMANCEWALRHINESDYWTTETELQYYLSCLNGDKKFSNEERDELMK